MSVANDHAVTTLNGDIGSSDVTIPVVDTSPFAVPCIIVIDSEIVFAKNKAGNSFTQCLRAFAGTVGAIHTSTTSVFGYVVAYHHNQVAVELTSLTSYVFNHDLSGFNKNENLLLYSEAFDNVAWTKASGVTVSTNGAVLPNGSGSFALLEGNSLGQNAISATPVGLTIGQPYIFSVYAKYDSIRWLLIGQHLSGSENAWAWFDIQNGIIGTIGSGAKAVIASVGNGWYRCLVVIDCTADTYKAFDICLASADGARTYLGTTTNSTIISGAQVRSGDVDGPISYIKTFGATFSEIGSGDLILDEGDLS